MAFILAGLVFAGAAAFWLLSLFASGMSDSSSGSAEAMSTANFILLAGTVVAVLIGATHWLPHIGW